MKRRLLSLLCVLLLVLGLTACQLLPTGELHLQNRLDTALKGVYITHSSAGDWGEPINTAQISAGGRYDFDFSAFGGQAGVYDINLLDVNRMNYSFYSVSLAAGDTLTLSLLDEGFGRLEVKTAAGDTVTYPGAVYQGGE